MGLPVLWSLGPPPVMSLRRSSPFLPRHPSPSHAPPPPPTRPPLPLPRSSPPPPRPPLPLPCCPREDQLLVDQPPLDGCPAEWRRIDLIDVSVFNLQTRCCWPYFPDDEPQGQRFVYFPVASSPRPTWALHRGSSAPPTEAAVPAGGHPGMDARPGPHPAVSPEPDALTHRDSGHSVAVLIGPSVEDLFKSFKNGAKITEFLLLQN